MITRVRHRLEVEKAIEALQGFLYGSMNDPELRAEDLRIAATALGRLTGRRIDVFGESASANEAILVFGEFCIGK